MDSAKTIQGLTPLPRRPACTTASHAQVQHGAKSEPEFRASYRNIREVEYGFATGPEPYLMAECLGCLSTFTFPLESRPSYFEPMPVLTDAQAAELEADWVRGEWVTSRAGA